MTHHRDSKQHLLTGLGQASRECQTIGTCLSNMFCRGRSHVQGGVFIVQPARWRGGIHQAGGQNASPTSSPGWFLRSDCFVTQFPFPSLWSWPLCYGQQLSWWVFGGFLQLWHPEGHGVHGQTVPHASHIQLHMSALTSVADGNYR